MFWFLFILFILIFAFIGGAANLFDKMRESEYEPVRIIYWILLIAFYVAIIGLLMTC
jgi:hypothetical protein